MPLHSNIRPATKCYINANFILMFRNMNGLKMGSKYKFYIVEISLLNESIL